MRTQDERDEQSLDIASAVFVCALIVAVGAGLLWLGGNAVGDIDDRTLYVLVVAGVVAGVAYLVRHRRR